MISYYLQDNCQVYVPIFIDVESRAQGFGSIWNILN